MELKMPFQKRLVVSFFSMLVAPVMAFADGHKYTDKHNHEHQHSDHHATSEQAHIGAHEHGVAQMFLTIVDNAVLVEVKSPLYNMLGFEHKPNNPEQKAAIKQQMQAIKSGTLIQVSDAAKCTLTQQQLSNPFHHDKDEAKHSSEHHHHEHNAMKGHKDLSFEYQFNCKQPQELNKVNAMPLFKAWPNLQNLRVEWIYKNQQSATTLSPNSASINF